MKSLDPYRPKRITTNHPKKIIKINKYEKKDESNSLTSRRLQADVSGGVRRIQSFFLTFPLPIPTNAD